MSKRALQIFETMRRDLPAEELAALRHQVQHHKDDLRRAQVRSELIAVDLAEALAARLDGLLANAHLMQAEARAHVVGAAAYFISSADERPDDQSCTGLDDDVLVFNHVARLLGRADLVIDD